MKIKLRITGSCNHSNLSLKYFSIVLFKIIKILSKFKICLRIALILFAIVNIQAQEDSLKNKSYKYLFEKLNDYYTKDIDTTKVYIHAYLKKAKKDNDSLKITRAFYYLSQYNDYTNSIHYIDSAFAYNQTPVKNQYHLLLNYRLGYLHYNKGKYKEALDNYLKAKELIYLSKDKILSSGIEYNIGLVRLRIGEFEKALNVFKISYDVIIKNNFQAKYSEIYLRNLAVLTNSYWHLNKLDSATLYNNLSLQNAIKYNSTRRYNESRVTQAIINYKKGNYKKGLDSIIKYAPLIEKSQDSFDLVITYLYKGKLYVKLNDWRNAIKNFKKVDTIVQNNKRYTVEIGENYKILYEYYKKNGDSKNHILYLERLLNFDSILYNNNAYLKTTFLDKYDAPKLIEEKETLIAKLELKDYKKSNIVYILSGSIIILLSMLYYYYRKKQTYKKRFEKLIKNKPVNPINTLNSNTIKKELNISNTVVLEVLKKMENFEKENQFLSNKITLNSLAKKLGTNSAYLSRIINFHKNQSFSAYLTSHRINYAIEALKKQRKLRGYTVKAIAFEVGFKNSESFTTAFYKETKLYPSYFIKELQKREKASPDL